MVYTNLFEFSIYMLTKEKSKKYILILACLVFTITVNTFYPVRTIPFTQLSFIWQLNFILFVFVCPFVYDLYIEYPRYKLVSDMQILYNQPECFVVYISAGIDVKFCIDDISLFEIYRTFKDERYIGYVIHLNNGERLRFTNYLNGVKELQHDIEASGVKVENKTWFNVKELPENIYV